MTVFGLTERIDRIRSRRQALREIATSGLFDPDFYASRYAGSGVTVETALSHYLGTGMARSAQPSAAFDPALYLALNPDVAASGEAPLLHYIRSGRAEGRPLPEPRAALAAEIAASGLFDPEFYARHHPEAAGAPLDHYLDQGLSEGLRPSAAFDPALYLALNPDVAAEGEAPLLHFIRTGRAEGRPLPDVDAAHVLEAKESGLFDPEFYVALYPDVARSGADPFDHYLKVGGREGRRPSAEFDAAAYLAANPDVAASGTDPLMHYVLHGEAEKRALPGAMDRAALQLAREEIAASGLFDADFYVSRNPIVRERGIDPILHYLVEGAATHLDPSSRFSALAYAARQPGFEVTGNALLRFLRADLPAGEAIPRHKDLRDDAASWPLGGKVLIARMATMAYLARYGFTLESSGPTTHVFDAVADLAAGRPEDMVISDAPDVSIVIPVYGQMPFVVSCLDALFHHRSRFSIEILVADDASPAEHRTRLLGAVPWIRYQRNRENLGFLDNCNAAVAAARGRFVVLLNSDTRVLDGWLDELIGSFDLFPKAGFVGSKLLNADGTLQEAGGLYWSDGTAWNYGRNQDPDDPRYNFARRVDWVSGASIAVPTRVWREMGGFDVAYRPAYCEDVDLAFRIRESGSEVWYQPLSCVLHFEGKTHGTDETRGIKAYQVRNLRRLRQRWAGRLPGTRPGGFEPAREANRSSSRRMLVIDANIPMPDRDAGSVVASQMMAAYRQLGYDQTFVPLDGFAYRRTYVEACQRQGVEVAYAPFITSIDALLERDDGFDYVLAYRHGIVTQVLDALRRRIPLTRIVFSNVDLHFLREEREAALKADRSLKISAARTETQELAVFTQVDCSIVHTAEEAAVVDTRLPRPTGNIVVFPWVAKVVRNTPDRAMRRNLMFLGGFPHQPNVDAMVFFMEEVWPRLIERLPDDARFLIVGNAPPNRVRAFADERVIVTGHVPDVEPYLAQARVFIAPLRYGAGIKGKVINSLSHGVPTVATPVAVEGIPVADGREIVLADSADAIVDGVIRLYDDADLWEGLRLAGFRFVDENYSWNSALKICETSLEVADATWMAREKERRQALLDPDGLPTLESARRIR